MSCPKHTFSQNLAPTPGCSPPCARLQVFDHMQASGVEADVVACCSLINALERGGQWQLAEKLFLQMCTVQASLPRPPASSGALPAPAN